jgi:citrate synthase
MARSAGPHTAGFDIHDLAGTATFEEIAYLLLPGAPPSSRAHRSLHGGADEHVMHTFDAIRKSANGDAALTAVEPEVRVRLPRGEKIMGFGAGVYQVEDPRASHLRQMSAEFADSSGDGTSYRMSRRMEEILLAERGLYPNVDSTLRPCTTILASRRTCSRRSSR